MEHKSHFGVYALILRDDSLLVIRKGRGPYTGLFDLPGGSPEDAELLEQTLVREVLEETHCTVTRHRQLGAFSALFPYTKDGQPRLLRHTGVIYEVEIEGTPNTQPDGHDSEGCLWLPLAEVTETNSTPFIRQALAHHRC